MTLEGTRGRDTWKAVGPVGPHDRNMPAGRFEFWIRRFRPERDGRRAQSMSTRAVRA